MDFRKTAAKVASSARRTGAFGGNAPAEAMQHALEWKHFFRGAFFVTAPISLTRALLSDRIYKICTLLSTGFVENARERRPATLPKALPGAGFRGVGPPPL
jgi:hypothetical protein